jgi:hypothetical protein
MNSEKLQPVEFFFHKFQFLAQNDLFLAFEKNGAVISIAFAIDNIIGIKENHFPIVGYVNFFLRKG